ncbi:MAG: hypothetical protein JNM27_16665 [Leptospirales bacterium]|nr:hypothetical protein [Leptospirales bacterium]
MCKLAATNKPVLSGCVHSIIVAVKWDYAFFAEKKSRRLTLLTESYTAFVKPIEEKSISRRTRRIRAGARAGVSHLASAKLRGWIARWPGSWLLICLCLLSGRTLHAQQGAFFGAFTVAGGSLQGELVSRINDRETFRLRQLAFLQINQVDRRNIQLLTLNSLPERPGRFTEGGFAFEYLLFDWFGIGKTFAWQRGQVSNVQGYQTFLRDTTLLAMLLFPDAHANAPPGLLEAAAASRKTVYTRISSSGIV